MYVLWVTMLLALISHLVCRFYRCKDLKAHYEEFGKKLDITNQNEGNHN